MRGPSSGKIVLDRRGTPKIRRNQEIWGWRHFGQIAIIGMGGGGLSPTGKVR